MPDSALKAQLPVCWDRSPIKNPDQTSSRSERCVVWHPDGPPKVLCARSVAAWVPAPKNRTKSERIRIFFAPMVSTLPDRCFARTWRSIRTRRRPGRPDQTPQKLCDLLIIGGPRNTCPSKIYALGPQPKFGGAALSQQSIYVLRTPATSLSRRPRPLPSLTATDAL